MAITHVVGQSGRNSGDSANNLVVTMAAIPTNGNVLVAVIGITDTTGYINVNSITQTNVTWTLQKRVQAFPNNWVDSYFDVEIWYGVVAAAALAPATIALSGAPNNRVTADIYEYSGMSTVGFLDVTASNSGIAAQTDTGTTLITTQADELWIGSVAHVDHNDQITPTNGFTLYDGVHEHSSTGRRMSLSYLEKIVAVIATANSGTTVVNADWAGCIATFKGGALAAPKGTIAAAAKIAEII